MITREDVIFVADMFNIILSDKQINFVVDNFESETKQDPRDAYRCGLKD